jgi:exosome complex component RRP45
LLRHEGASSAEVKIGRTRALAEVSGELVQPKPDRPSEGIIAFAVDFSPLASETFQAGRPPAAAVELGRVVERAVRDSHALDVEALCVIHGERVWAIQVKARLGIRTCSGLEEGERVLNLSDV